MSIGLTENLAIYGPALLGAAIVLALAGAGLAWAAPRNGVAGWAWALVRRRPLLAGAVMLAALLLTAGAVYAGRVAAREQALERERRLVDASSNLVPNPGLEGLLPDATAPAAWNIEGTAPLIMRAETQLRGVAKSGFTWVRPGERFSYSFSGWTSGVGHLVLVWHDAALVRASSAITKQEFPLRGQPAFVEGSVVAPEGAGFLQVELHSGDSPLTVEFVRVAPAGVRVEQWPMGARAALAFSFDWETAMGGLIHSWGYELPSVEDAERRGMNMRQGADLLQRLFAEHDVQATFYANGYNLLFGNLEKREYAGNPVYNWKGMGDHWASDFWMKNPWYVFDPYSTVEDEPAWYFGDQTKALMAEGHEVASHTFGHLWVRGATPEQLDVDAGEWNNAADAIGVPRATSFAFPWQSSNSVKAPFYEVLAGHGIRSVTRMYPVYSAELEDRFQITALSVYTPFVVMPDVQLGPARNEAEASGQEATPEAAKRIVDEAILRRGVTSFWTHPEVLVLPEVYNAWAEVVAYAAGKRDEGQLFIAPVSEIVGYRRDVGKVRVEVLAGNDTVRLRVTNGAERELEGVTLTLPGAASGATVGGQPLPMPRPDQAIVPMLQPGETVEVEIDMRAGD